MMKRMTFIALVLTSLLGCTLPQAIPSPAPTALLPTALPPTAIVPIPSATSVPPIFTPTPPPTWTSTPLPGFCSDSRVAGLFGAFAGALAAANGDALAALISPLNGVDVRFIRDGRVVNYDRAHFAAVFASTYQVEWGLAPGSGLPMIGSFQEIILPSLRIVFTPSAHLTCNQIKLGGATYAAAWPAEYTTVNFYSVHFPGTDQYGGMDWQTWLTGVEMESGQPLLRVLLHFAWEP
ncbi:MAG: hypothetical protein HFACDABA_02092 [Anaerolineales bacterium]|nr:hypothetical protein [Anaerolineales bacterium]